MLLARTYVYLSIAYLGLSQVEAARSKFLEALSVDRDIELTPSEFPPRYLSFFEETIKELDATEAASAGDPGAEKEEASSTPSAGEAEPVDSVTTTAEEDGKKGRSKALLAILGVGAGVGAAVALAGGGGDGSPSTASTPAPAPDPTATVTSPQEGTVVSCTDDIHVVVTVENPTPNALAVAGVENTSESTGGGCEASPPFTFTPLVSSVAARSTAVVLDKGLYGSDGCGCCSGECGGGTCSFRETFTVVSGVGPIPAGAIDYSIHFSGCVPCASASGRQAVGRGI
jgi:hypothetical protein